MSERAVWSRRIGIGALVLVGLAGVGAVVAYLAFTPDPTRIPPATVAHDPSLPTLVLGDRKVHGERFGDPLDPVIVVLHGGPGGDYRNLLGLRVLADEGFHVVFYDQLGSGLSPRVPAEGISLDAMVDELDAVIELTSRGQPVALLGHSWGGMLGAYYLAAHPEKVARAVLAEPGVLTTEEYRSFAAAMQPPITPTMVTTLGRSWIESLHIDGPDDDAPLDYLVASAMGAPVADNPMNAYWCGGSAPDAAHEMARVGATTMQAIQAKAVGPDGTPEMPPLDISYPHEVLLIASRCNTLIGVQRQTDHLALFPNARLAVIEDAGHLMFTDQPEASLDAVRSYLLGWSGTPSREWLLGTWSLTGECQTDHLVEAFEEDGTWTAGPELGTWELVNRRLSTTTTLRREHGADTSEDVEPPAVRTVRLERVGIDRGRIHTEDGRQVPITRCSDR